MRDDFGRKIDYMRLSITDRCNLRCMHCMPNPVPNIPHDDIMRFEELLRLCGIMAKLGVKTVRVTGGEPLVRKDCMDFIRELKKISGIENVALTTNAVLLEPYIEDLAAIGLKSLNISLNALCPGIYHKLTGFNAFDKVWAAINKAVESGLRVKINCVPIKGENESQILPLASLAYSLPIDVRFIELMPTGASGNLTGISMATIIEAIMDKYPGQSRANCRRPSSPGTCP